MTTERLEIKQRLKDDFLHYAPRCLSIRTKSGVVEPFKLNKAQLHIHEQLERQRGQTGKVRALILKGRQQGCCFSEQMKVLLSNMTWVFIKDIKVGDELVACDEECRVSAGVRNKSSRKFRTAVVEHTQSFIKETFEVLFDNGARLEVTDDHRMLCKKRGGCEPQWRHVRDFIIGDEVRVVARPPNYKTLTHEDGWFSGIIDGEGSQRGSSGAKRLSVHQTSGEILQRMKKYFCDIDMPYKEVIDYRTRCGQRNKLGDKPVHRLDIHRLPYLIELFARCRPTRFTNDRWYEGHELPGKAAQDGIRPWTKVVSIRTIGRKRVIDLQTSTKTFICEGLVSHNSTYVGGRFYHKVTWNKGIQAFILTHALDATQNLYKMAQRFYENTPDAVKPQVTTSNAKELIFGLLDSGYKLGTAENKAVGRSATIQLLHGSEVAFWNNASEHAKGIMQAVPNAVNTEIILESTANGVGNFFHQQWQLAEAGLSEYVAIFVPWFWQDEYQIAVADDFIPTSEEQELQVLYGLSNGQIAWRRNKIQEFSVNGMDGVKAFHQEYPCVADEAFTLTGEDNYIDSQIIMTARKTEAEKYGKLLIGVDPARFGDDRTSIIRRQGRVAFGLESYSKKDTMEVVGLVHKIIETEHPFKVLVDVGGLGAGIVDRLYELGHRDVVVGVNAGSAALDARKYKNKRAEMWALCKEWLLDYPCQIPDDDSLHSDLSGVKYTFNSNSQLQIERKEDMKKRGIRSPDNADALCLTFSLPLSALQDDSKTAKTAVLSNLGANMRKLDKLRIARDGIR